MTDNTVYETGGETTASDDTVAGSALEHSLVDRRAVLALLGAVALPLGVSSVTATESDEDGYGHGEYGADEYGDTTRESTDGDPPIIDEWVATEDSPPNPHAEITVDWTVSAGSDDLRSVLVSVYERGASTSPIETARERISGSNASGSTTLHIQQGAGSSYTVELEGLDEAGRTTADTMDIRA